MNKKYIAPKQLVINLATEALLANSDPLNTTLGDKRPDNDNYEGENQYSRQSGSAWDAEW